ncbi:MAG TPA: aminotransferase class IV, partial [Acidiferrobacteraceae bacterium]|nr:aminotransferase class IV [Acidiferrobacteraceae bacterium]
MISILVNGEQQETVSVLDRGLTYGDGLFETLAVRDGRPLLWAEHIARLRQGSERLGLPDIDEQLWAREAQAVCSGQPRAVLKLMWTRGPSERGYQAPVPARATRVVVRSSWPRYPRGAQRDGVSVRICRHFWSRQPRLAGLKHLNRLDNVLARNEWSTEFAEGLMRDEQG